MPKAKPGPQTLPHYALILRVHLEMVQHWVTQLVLYRDLDNLQHTKTPLMNREAASWKSIMKISTIKRPTP